MIIEAVPKKRMVRIFRLQAVVKTLGYPSKQNSLYFIRIHTVLVSFEIMYHFFFIVAFIMVEKGIVWLLNNAFEMFFFFPFNISLDHSF